MWLQYSGHTPAELTSGTQIHGGNLPASLLQRRPGWEDVIKSLPPVIRDYLQKKRTDDIANLMRNMEQPPRAESVDPSLQGAPATRPFRGGSEGLKLNDLYQEHLDQAAKQEQEGRLREARISRLTAPDSVMSDDPAEQRRQAAEQRREAQFQSGQADNWTKLDKDIFATSGHHLGDWNAAKNKRIEGDQFLGDDADSNTLSVPASIYQSALARYNSLQGKGVVAGPPAPAAAANDEATKANAAAIREAYRNKQMSKEDAIKRLQALGFE